MGGAEISQKFLEAEEPGWELGRNKTNLEFSDAGGTGVARTSSWSGGNPTRVSLSSDYN